MAVPPSKYGPSKHGVAEESSDMAGRIYSTYFQQEKCIE